jgi:hypothetical protein
MKSSRYTELQRSRPAWATKGEQSQRKDGESKRWGDRKGGERGEGKRVKTLLIPHPTQLRPRASSGQGTRILLSHQPFSQVPPASSFHSIN